MTGERRKRIRELFADALKLPSSERSAFLIRSCGSDRDLLAQVESLLSESSSTETLSGGPQIGGRLQEADQRLLNSRLKERCLLRSVLGRGGFSIVYLATDEQLLSKRVVVK